jgi:hypothetical protein
MADAHSKLSPSDIEVVRGSVDPTRKLRIQVSMHSVKCSGRFLEVVCAWLDLQGICDLEIQLSDTLQRHNIAWRDGLGEADAYLLSRERGDEWLRRNRWTIEFCHKNFEKMAITRWDYWIRHTGFAPALKLVSQLFETDRNFRDLINSGVEGYFQRINVDLDNIKMDLSRRFICEEIAVSLVSNKFDFSTELYPGPGLEAEAYLAEKCPEDLQEFDKSFVSIAFRTA